MYPLIASTAFFGIILIIMVAFDRRDAIKSITSSSWESKRTLESVLTTVVASGFLGGSIALLTAYKSVTFQHTLPIKVAFVAFGLALILTILSHLSYSLSANWHVNRLKRRPFGEVVSDEEWESYMESRSKMIWGSFHFLLIFSLLTGIVSLVLFGLYNF